MSAFHLATKRLQVGIMENLSILCPDIGELMTSNGQTALYVAARSGKKHAVDYLLNLLLGWHFEFIGLGCNFEQAR